jgi:hypothetical protein
MAGFTNLGTGTGFKRGKPIEWIPIKQLLNVPLTIQEVLKTTETYRGKDYDKALFTFTLPDNQDNVEIYASSTHWSVAVKKLYLAEEQGLLPLPGVFVFVDREENGYYDLVDPEDNPMPMKAIDKRQELPF